MEPAILTFTLSRKHFSFEFFFLLIHTNLYSLLSVKYFLYSKCAVSLPQKELEPLQHLLKSSLQQPAWCHREHRSCSCTQHKHRNSTASSSSDNLGNNHYSCMTGTAGILLSV